MKHDAAQRPTPFDDLAADYDLVFTHSRIGTLMRQAVWRHLDACFQPGGRILELNCGTGEDAVHLAQRGVYVLATDISAAMVDLARCKVEQGGVSDRVAVRQMAAEEVLGVEQASPHHSISPLLPFDGALSNFGGLNCVEDLRGVAEGLAACLRPGARAFLCWMGPICLWEWGWYLRKGQPGRAFRRLRRGGAVWRGLTVRYPGPRAVRRAFAPEFRLRRAVAIGALIPPTYAAGWAAKHPRLLSAFNRWERRLESVFPFPWIADHCLLEMERGLNR
jgi:SAM-dependent methyltransferase